MALVLADRVKETTTTTGTGAVTLDGAVTGFNSFSDIGNGNTTYYVISHIDADEYEIGVGTYTSATTSLSRDTILRSSNSDLAVNFSAGTKNVFVVIPEDKSVFKDGNGDISISGGDILFGDNDKAIFGAGSDLQIYHQSADNHSNIRETGTGNLQIWGSNTTFLNTAGSKLHASFVDAGAVTLYYDGSPKLATTSGGIDVTGTVTADGLTVDVTSTVGQTLHNSAGTSVYTRYQNNSGNDNYIGYTGNNFEVFPNNTKALAVASGGDVSLYDSSGVSQGFFWDASTQRLGLGTTTPGNKLSIANNNYIAWKNNAGSSETIAIRANTSDGLEFLTGSTRMTITSGGNVGIGTSSPSSFDAAGDNLVVGTGSGNNGMTVYSGTINAGSLFFADGTGTAAEKADGYIQYTHSNQALAFATGGGSERMRIDSSGNVGIGTTSPGVKLDNAGSFRSTSVTDPSSGAGLELCWRGTAADVLSYDRDTSQFKELQLRGEPVAFLNSGGERMRITSGGSVNIGGTGAQAKFEVNSAVSTTGSLTDTTINLATTGVTGRKANIGFGLAGGVANTNAATIGFDVTNGAGALQGDLFFSTRGSTSDSVPTERMRIDSSGNVGIGTNSPSSLLSIFKGTGTSQLQFGASSNYYWDVSRDNDVSGALIISNKNAGAVTERMRIDSSGNVGIGTSSPDRSLHIAGSEPTVVLENTGQGTDLKTWRMYSNSSSLQIGTVDDAFASGQNALEIGRDNTDNITSIQFKTGASSERMRIDTSGNVGIGTTSPASKLHVDGSFRQTGATAPFEWTVNAGASDYYKLNAVGYADNLIVANSSGNVGIGTNSPSSSLTVSGDIEIVGGNKTLKNSSGFLQVGTTSSDYLAFLTNNTERARIDSSGNVGIGTSSPIAQSKLTVGGGAGSISVTGSDGNFAAGGQRSFIDFAIGKARIGGTGGGGAGTTLGLYVGTGTEAVSVTAAGNVGIGTSSPSTALQVSGTVTATAFVGDGSGLTGVGGTPPSVQVFTANGTWTKPASCTRVRVTVIGGGGGGGGCNTSFNGKSSGGGGGGTATEWIDVTAVSTVSVTVGGGGSGVNAGSGNTGGTSSFGAYCSATGGVGGNVNNDAAGNGGIGSGGSWNSAGDCGGQGAGASGAGGGSSFGGGGRGVFNGNGNSGAAYGGGGSGGSTVGTGYNRSGGSGAAGVVIVEEFY